MRKAIILIGICILLSTSIYADLTEGLIAYHGGDDAYYDDVELIVRGSNDCRNDDSCTLTDEEIDYIYNNVINGVGYPYDNAPYLTNYETNLYEIIYNWINSLF